MTEKDFLKLLVRERDALIAEKVMGFDVDDIYEHEEMGDEVGWIPITNMPFDHVPHYTTSIVAAWEVFGIICKADTEYGSCSIHKNSDKLHSENEVFLANYDILGRRYFGYANTAPLAICIAALKVTGVITND